MQNSGTVEVYSASTLTLDNSTISGGTIYIDNTDSVLVGSGTSAIANATINNFGALETGGTFTLDNDIINGGILTGTGAVNTSFNLDQGASLTLNGVTVVGGNGGVAALDNAGSVALETSMTLGSSNPPFASSAFTLELNGSGTVALNGATISATAAGETLENNGNTLSGGGTIGDGSGKLTLDNNAGTIDAQGGTLTIDTGDTVTNAGALEANGGTLKILDAVTGAGSATVAGGGTLELGSTDAETVTFSGAGDTLALDRQDLHDFTGTIGGFGAGDTVDLKALTFGMTEAYQWTENQGGTGGTLTVTSGNASESVTLAGSYVTNDFALTTDAGSGTDVVAGPGRCRSRSPAILPSKKARLWWRRPPSRAARSPISGRVRPTAARAGRPSPAPPTVRLIRCRKATRPTIFASSRLRRRRRQSALRPRRCWTPRRRSRRRPSPAPPRKATR